VGKLKNALRQASPNLYAGLIGLRRGPVVRAIAGFHQRRRMQTLVRSGIPFSMDISARMGLGAVFASLVALHHHFENAPGLRKIVSSNPLYLEEGQPGDVLDLFLDRLYPHAPAGYEDQRELPLIPFTSDYDISLKPLSRGLRIQRAHELFNRHYRVKRIFLDEAESFCAANFSQAIGVHFRGSDKRIEAPVVAWEAIAKALDERLDAAGQDNGGAKEIGAKKIFVASDETDFIEFIRRRYGADRMCALDCQFVADGLTPAHFQPGSGLAKGREALLTMLILARCSVVIRGASFLSGWAKVLNPGLPIVMLGKPYGREVFPEVEIMEESAAAHRIG